MLERIEKKTQDSPEYSVIWLHGLGADGSDFEPIVTELNLNQFPIRFIFPHAPFQSVTINGGMEMRAWYDIIDIGPGAPEDDDGIKASCEAVRELIQTQIEDGIPSEHIFLAGFSQGGAIALHTGLTHEEPLGGIIALSTYLPFMRRFPEGAHDENSTTPIFMAHGLMDPIVPFNAGEASQAILEAHDYPIEWHTYPMEHNVCPEEITDISRWLQERLERLED